MDKKELYEKVLEIVKDAYSGSKVLQSDLELLAHGITECVESADIVSIPNEVDFFWEEEAKGDAPKGDDDPGWSIFYNVLYILEPNEKNAKALLEVMDGIDDYNTFQLLVTDFREFLAKDELEYVFERAECFDDDLVDCYKDDED